MIMNYEPKGMWKESAVLSNTLLWNSSIETKKNEKTLVRIAGQRQEFEQETTKCVIDIPLSGSQRPVYLRSERHRVI